MADEFMERTLDDVGRLSPDEAKASIKSVMAAAAKDPQHPYLDRSNIQHKDAVEQMQALFVQANPEPEAQVDAQGKPLSNPIPQSQVDLMGEALEKKDGKDEESQGKLIEAVEEDYRILVQDFDYEDSSVPDDLTPDLAALIRMQRLTAQEDYAALKPMVNKFSRFIPPENQKVFNGFLDLENIDPVDKQKHMRIILDGLNRNRKTTPQKKGFGAV